MKSLHRIKRLGKIESRFYVFDVETQGLQARPEAFIFGCIYGYNYRRVFFSHKEFEEILLDKRFNKSIIFAHHAEFDLNVMYGHIIKNLDAKAIFNNKFICARRHKFLFADSFNIFGFGVKAIGEQIGLPKLDLDDGFKTGNIREITHKHVEYCMRDCEIVWRALRKVFDITGAVKITLAGLALAYFRNTFIKSVIHSDDNLIYEFFNSYYGGRVEAFQLGKTKAYKYDVNSMYPYAMEQCVFPNPQYLKKIENVSLEYFEYLLSRHEGCAKVRVLHSKSKIGLLPYRSGEKLIFPVGTFTGVFNFNELRFAIGTGKVTIKEVFSVVHGPKYESPFKEFVRTVYKLRSESTGIDKTIYKLILNSLYGKFAQKISSEDEYFTEIPHDRINKLMKDGKKFEISLFSEKRSDGFLKIAKEKYLLHTIPLFSSYITSYSRCHLLSFMLENERSIVYCDTDSICCTSNISKYNSALLGQMKKENAVIVEVYGNKSYKEVEDGEEKVKLKGVPKSAKKNILGDYEYNAMIKTKSALRRNVEPGTFSIMSKRLLHKYDKRTVKANGKTTAIKLT